ncbi:MAG: hypothetical protein IIU32_02510, partial [Firmicutes bacterium]|nr:hypothetical protein [Bacillota bacterium]
SLPGTDAATASQRERRSFWDPIRRSKDPFRSKSSDEQAPAGPQAAAFISASSEEQAPAGPPKGIFMPEGAPRSAGSKLLSFIYDISSFRDYFTII